MRSFLAHGRTDVTDREADPLDVRAVASGAVDEVGVVKRHLTRVEDEVDRGRLVYGVGDREARW